MESTSLIAFGPTEYYHINSSLAADSACARLPRCIFQGFPIGLTVTFPAVEDLLVCIKAVNHVANFYFTGVITAQGPHTSLLKQ